MISITRRGLILGVAAAAGGGTLLLSAPLLRRLAVPEPTARPLGGTAWLHIDPDGTITVYSNVAEMGQGSVSGLLQALADELDADWTHMRFDSAPVTDAFSGANGHYTGGSRSLRNHLSTYRHLGALARSMLVQAAATRWSVARSECSTEPGLVVHQPSARRLQYGELASDASQLPVPRHVQFKKPHEWRYIGRPMQRLDLPAKVDGSARFGIDVDIPGMKFAAIRHCPVRDGRLRNVSPEPALSVAGVSQVVQLSDAVAVIADSFWPALQGANALQPQWNIDPAFRQSSEDLDRLLVQLVEQAERKLSPGVLESLRQAEGTITASYQVPPLAQVPLEPMNATAKVQDGRAEIWAPTQAARHCQQQVAEALGVPIGNVTIHVQMMGGGFGRRLHNDYAVMAALVARKAGVPVKLIWSREEDFLRTTVRPAARALFRARLGRNGFPELLAISCAALDPYAQTGALEDQPYDVRRVQIRYQGNRTAARTGYWRSVDYSQNIFFLESFVDECAMAANLDPLDYRLTMLKRNAPARDVLNALGDLSRYRAADRPERPIGIAYCEGFGSRVAIAVELRPAGGFDYSDIVCIYCVADCGLVINSDSVTAQLQGSILQALSATLHEKVFMQDGAIATTTLADYGLRAPSRVPPLVVKLLDTSSPEPGGVGELGIPALAPALTNAIHAATGVRYRTLPLIPRRTPSA